MIFVCMMGKMNDMQIGYRLRYFISQFFRIRFLVIGENVSGCEILSIKHRKNMLPFYVLHRKVLVVGQPYPLYNQR